MFLPATKINADTIEVPISAKSPTSSSRTDGVYLVRLAHMLVQLVGFWLAGDDQPGEDGDKCAGDGSPLPHVHFSHQPGLNARRFAGAEVSWR